MTPPDLFQRLIENSNVIGWDADPQTFHYNYVSPYAETLLGYPTERWKENGFWQSKIHPDDVDHAIGFCKASTEKLESHEFEYRMISSTGRHVWLRDIAAVESSNGLPTRLYGIMFDITPEKEAMQALAQARDDALQADRTKTRFLANISHELRTPMNAILGFTDFLIGRDQYVKKPVDLDEYLELIQRSATHLSTLIDDLLELSRYEIGVDSLKLEPVDASDTVAECCAMLDGLASTKNISLTVDLPIGPLAIEADKKGLKQVIINLINNALKFTPPEGRIHIAARMSVDSIEGIEIIVTDSGIGMSTPPNTMPSNQKTGLSGSTKSQYRDENSGMGLGLSIVSSVLKLHGGKIRFSDVDEGGTRATVWLPRNQ